MRIIKILGIMGLAMAGIASFVDYMGWFPGCALCHVERAFLWAAGALTLLSTCRGLRWMSLPVCALWAGLSGLGFYHTGVQYHLWPIPAFCEVPALKGNSEDERFDHFMARPALPSCDSRTFDLLGVPAALWLAVGSLMATGIILGARRRRLSAKNP